MMRINNYFPLWVVITTWFLQKRRAGIDKADGSIPKTMPFYLLGYLRCSLPVPKRKFETWLTRIILEWIDRQELQILQQQWMEQKKEPEPTREQNMDLYQSYFSRPYFRNRQIVILTDLKANKSKLN